MSDPVGNIEPIKKSEPRSGRPEIANILVRYPSTELTIVPCPGGVTEQSAGIEVQVQLGVGWQFPWSGKQ